MKKLFITAALILAAVFSLGFVVGRTTAKPAPKPVAINYPVASGQTLWEIAGSLKKEYGDSRDIRDIIYNIRKDNGGIDTLYSGEVLKITIYAEREEGTENE